MKLSSRIPIVLALSSLFSVPGAAQSVRKSGAVPPSRQVVVTLRPTSDEAATVKRVAARVGRVFVRNPRLRSYRLLLNPGVTTRAAITKLKGDKAVSRAYTYKPRPHIPLANMTSVRSIDTMLSRLEARAKWRALRESRAPSSSRLTGKVAVSSNKKIGADEEEGAGTDYYRAYRYWYKQRAFPLDRIPANAYTKAVAHRDRMKAAPLGRRSSGITAEKLTGTWEFVGPRNLDVPYRIYWGPRPVAGRVNAMAFDRNNPGRYYAAGAGGGIWVTYDYGVTWTPMSDDWPHQQVSSIAVDPKDSNTIYVGSGDFDGGGVWSFGLMKTTDAGASWAQLGAAEFGRSSISKIVVDPDNTNIVTIATGRSFEGGNSRVWRTEDGGASWTAVIPVSCNWQDLELGITSVKNVRYLFAAGDNGNIWRSADRGKTWMPCPSPVDGPINIAMSSNDFATIYVISAADAVVFKSIDSGQTWTDVSGSLTDNDPEWSQAGYDMHIGTALGIDPWGYIEDTIYIGLIDLWQGPTELSDYRSIGLTTTDGALTHNDQHDMTFNPFDPMEALVGNDGGAYRFTYSQAAGSWTFDSLNKNLGITQFYRAAWHPTDPNIMFGGTQDNATPVCVGDLDNWGCVAGGDGGGCAINPDVPRTQYATSYNAQVFRTGDLWASQEDISPNIGNDNAPFVTTIYIDPNDSNWLYMGTDHLWRWDDRTKTWTPRIGGVPLTTEVITAISIFPGHRDRIYTGASDGQIWMSTDQRLFTMLNKAGSGFPVRSVTGIDVNPKDRDDILVSVSGFGTGHMWRCFDTRELTPKFIDVSGTGADALPDVPINAFTRDPWYPDSTWYVATDIGVFMTTDAGAKWTNATRPLGLPNVQVNDIKAIAGTRFLNVATYGRGMWRIALPEPARIQSLSLNPTVVCEGGDSTGTVTLTMPAGSGGAVVGIATTDPTVTSVPATIIVPEGSKTGTFTINTQTVSSNKTATITASSTETGTSASAVLSIEPLRVSRVTVVPNPACAGISATGTVTLNCAPPSGATITLSSSNTAVATVPATVTVAAGASTATFSVDSPDSAVGKSATITGSANGSSASANVTFQALNADLKVNPSPVCGGEKATGLVTLNCPAPVGGVVVDLSSSNTGVASVPAQVTVPAGSNSTTFQVTTTKPAVDTNVTITSTTHGVSKTFVLNVASKVQLRLTFDPNPVRGGSVSGGTLDLNCPAPAGMSVTLSSSNPGVANPQSPVSVPTGALSRKFNVTTSVVNQGTDVTITATWDGASYQGILTVLPPTYPANQTFNPNPACANSFTLAKVNLNGPAPAGGAVVSLKSANTNVATVPASVTVLAGATSAQYTVTTKHTSVDTTVAITATYAGVSRASNLSVKAPTLSSNTITPATVKGGNNVTMTLNLTCPAPAGGAVITLRTSNSNRLEPPTSVTVPAGKTAQNFTFATKTATTSGSVTITATYNGIAKGATITTVP